jgi:hypothetical protein
LFPGCGLLPFDTSLAENNRRFRRWPPEGELPRVEQSKPSELADELLQDLSAGSKSDTAESDSVILDCVGDVGPGTGAASSAVYVAHSIEVQ